MTVLYTNNFEGYADGATPAGWTGYWTVYNWPAEAISGTGILVALGQSPGAFGKCESIAAGTVRDYTFHQKAKFNGASLPIHTVIHSDGSNIWADTFAYRVMFTASATGVTAAMAPFIDGGFPGGPSGSRSVAFATGDAIAVRFKVDGKTVSCWVWNSSTESMPVDPLVTWTDSTQRPAGFFTLALNNESAIANPVDNVEITDGATGGGAVTHAATGALAASASSVSGSAARSPAVVTHAASGALTASSATVAGAASRAGSTVTHAASGALVASAASIAAAAARTSTGQFVTDIMPNNTGTVLASVTVLWEWRIGAGIGVAPTSVTYGSGTTNGAGVLTATGLPAGTGELWVATPDRTHVFYQAGTVA